MNAEHRKLADAVTAYIVRRNKQLGSANPEYLWFILVSLPLDGGDYEPDHEIILPLTDLDGPDYRAVKEQVMEALRNGA